MCDIQTMTSGDMEAALKKEKPEPGLASLEAAVKRDCEREGDCRTFNPEGCTRKSCPCFHRYCDKFKWVVDRAKQYGEKTGIDWKEILAAWEKRRSYWYMNYYQDYNQPDLGNEDVRVFDTVVDAKASFRGMGFRCPSCGKISDDPDTCNHCKWSISGLLPSKGVYIFTKDRMLVFHLFMPVAYENKN